MTSPQKSLPDSTASSAAPPRRPRSSRLVLAAAGAATLVLAGCSSAPTPVPDPPGDSNVLDAADVLTDTQERELERLIEEGNARTDAARVAVLTESGYSGDIEDRAPEVAGQWGVGDAGADNGVLVLLDPQEQQVRLEVADGAAEAVTDAQAEAIIDDRMVPAFEDQDWAGGLQEGVSGIYRTAEGLEDPTEGGLSGWAIAGIIGGIAALAGLIVGWLCAVARRRRRAAREALEQARREDPDLELTEEQEQDYLRWAAGRKQSDLLPVTAWMPLYLAHPSSYGAQPTQFDSGSSGGGSSFGGGGGFTGGGATGSW